jgi:hypothetical protein
MDTFLLYEGQANEKLRLNYARLKIFYYILTSVDKLDHFHLEFRTRYI